jgi:hypothetical protein
VLRGNLVEGNVLLGKALRFLLSYTRKECVHPTMPSTNVMIKVRKDREILSVFFNILQGRTTDVIRSLSLGKKRTWVKPEVIPNGQNALSTGRLFGSYSPGSSTLEKRQSQRQPCALKETATVEGV